MQFILWKQSQNILLSSSESKEKKLLDGFLSKRERVREEVRKAAEEGRLF